MRKYKFWCYTINNPSSIETTAVEQMYRKSREQEFWSDNLDNPVTYNIVGYEGLKMKTFHLQGFVGFTQPVTFNDLKERFYFRRAHLEPMRITSTLSQAATYCKKEGVYHEYGKLSELKLANPTLARKRKVYESNNLTEHY